MFRQDCVLYPRSAVEPAPGKRKGFSPYYIRKNPDCQSTKPRIHKKAPESVLLRGRPCGGTERKDGEKRVSFRGDLCYNTITNLQAGDSHEIHIRANLSDPGGPDPL